MTETKPYSQSKKTYFSIVLNTAIKKRGWMYGLVLIASCINLYVYVSTENPAYLVWVIAGLGYLFFIYIYLYRFAHSGDKTEFLSEKQLFFDESLIRIQESVGGMGEFPFSRIKQVIDKSDFWMLYLSKNQFIYVPKDIFYRPEDFSQFEQNLREQSTSGFG